MPRKTRKSKARKEMKFSNVDQYLAKQTTAGRKICFPIPSGAKQWWPKNEGSVRMDIIPYQVGSFNPNCEEGLWHFELTYYAHKDAGPGKSSILCPYENYGDRCPICEANGSINRNPNADDSDLNYAKKRQLFNVLVHGEEDQGVQLWEYSYHQFGKQLVEKLQNADDDDDWQSFFHPGKEGLTLRLGFTEEKPYGLKVTDIEFRPRKKALSATILDQAHNLEEVVKAGEKSYAEIKKAFLSSIGSVDDEEEEDDDDEELEDDEIEDDDLDLDDDDDWEDEEEEESPKKKKSSKKSPPKKKPSKKVKKRKVVEEDDEEDDEEWDDEDEEDDEDDFDDEEYEEDEEDDDEDWG